MQTKKRAKPVKFGKAAKEAEKKVEKVEAPTAEPQIVQKPEEPVEVPVKPAAPAEPHTPAQPPQQEHELVDKLSDVPFETDFNTPSAQAPQAANIPEPIPAATEPEPQEPQQLAKPEAEPAPAELTPEAAPGESTPPIGRANEPVPFSPHDTVFNTPPEGSEKKKNPFLYFIIIAFVAFLTGLAFMAGIYYAMPDKNLFAMPGLPALPGAEQPTPTPALSSNINPTEPAVQEVKLADLTIQVLNGSGVRGEAAKVKTTLEAEGFKVGTVGNADRSDVTKTQIVVKKTVSQSALTKLKDTLKKTYVLEKETILPASTSQTNDIVITIGKETTQ